MPQMAPMNWIMLYILFSITFMIFNFLNYYIFKINNITKNFLKFNFKSLNWKW